MGAKEPHDKRRVPREAGNSTGSSHYHPLDPLLFTHSALNSSTPAILAFPGNANGETPILFTLVPSGAFNPTIDPAGNLWVVNVPAAIAEYAPDTSGNAVPLRVISGPNTGVGVQGQDPGGPSAVWVDGDGFIYVTAGNLATGRILIFAPGADGNEAPIRTIKGPATALTFPTDIAVSPVTGEIVVPNFRGANFLIFAPDANGDVAPVQTVPGRDGRFPLGVFFSSSGELYVTEKLPSEIVVLAKGSSGHYTVVRTITGPAMQMGSINQVALDEPGGKLFVSDFYLHNISQYPIEANGTDLEPAAVIHAAPGGMQIGAGMAVYLPRSSVGRGSTA